MEDLGAARHGPLATGQSIAGYPASLNRSSFGAERARIGGERRQ
jgi:hypothetical protein